MLVKELGGSQMKAMFPATVVQHRRASTPKPPPGSCPAVQNVTKDQGILMKDLTSLTDDSSAKNATRGF